MNIGIDARMYPYTGIGRYIQHLLYWLSQLDKENTYTIFLYKEVLEKLSFPENFTLVPVTERIYSIEEQWSLKKKFEEAKLDLLHVPHFNAPLLYKGRLILTIHDITQTLFASMDTLPSKIKKWGYLFAMAGVTRKAEKIIAVSDHTKLDLIKHFNVPNNKITSIYEAVDNDLQEQETNATSLEDLQKRYYFHTPYLLYVGLWSVHKNIPRLVEAFAKVQRKYRQPLQLILAGKRDERYSPAVMETIRKHHLGKYITLTGFISDADLKGLYEHASLFVFPSLYEGFGLPPLEAMAHNVPVVSSSASSLPEVLGPAAVYFNPEDTDAMADAILNVLNNPTLQNTLRQVGKEQVQKYSWKKMVEETLQLYRS